MPWRPREPGLSEHYLGALLCTCLLLKFSLCIVGAQKMMDAFHSQQMIDAKTAFQGTWKQSIAAGFGIDVDHISAVSSGAPPPAQQMQQMQLN